MQKPLSLLVALALLLSGCGFVSLATEDLLSPPKLTVQQSEIYDALRYALGTENFKLRYPQRGEYLSAFVFHNLDTDSDLEAVVFYDLTVNSVSSCWMSILDRNGEEWNAVYDLPIAGNVIDFIHFAYVSGEEQPNVVLSTSVQGREDKTVTVYEYTGSRLQSLYSGACVEVLFADMDWDGLDDMIFFTQSASRPASAKLIKYSGGSLTQADEVVLRSAVTEYRQVRYDLLDDGFYAVFVDVTVENRRAATQLLLAGADSIALASFADLGVDENMDRPLDSVNCADYTEDGYMNIPVTFALPGYDDQAEQDNMYLTRFLGMKGGKLVYTASAAVNKAGGYMLYFPDSWVDKVTVIPQPETGEWRFVVFDRDLDNSVQELLRIRVIATTDYQDKFSDDNYVLLEKRGAFEYYVYMPDSASASPLAIEFSRLGDLFRLLTA
jgi:hypothetical protein